MAKLRLVVNNPLGIPKNRYDPERDGVSPTLLGTWKSCREKARLRILGWKSRRLNGGQIFGTLAHGVLERIYGQIQMGKISTVPSAKQVLKICKEVEAAWKKDNPKADEETLNRMEQQMLLVEAVLPEYFVFWSRDLTKMDWWHLEQYVGSEAANRDYATGRTHVRGKMDGAFKSPKDRRNRMWLFETKSRSQFGEDQQRDLMDILPREMQVVLYLGALQDRSKGEVPGGVLYNIIRRPGLKQKKRENIKAFALRVQEDVRRRPQFYFLRFRMEIEAKEFRQQRAYTDAIVTDFLAWYHGKAPHYPNSDSCRTQYGPCEFLKMCSRKEFTGMYQSKPRREALEEK